MTKRPITDAPWRCAHGGPCIANILDNLGGQIELRWLQTTPAVAGVHIRYESTVGVAVPGVGCDVDIHGHRGTITEHGTRHGIHRFGITFTDDAR